MIRYGVINELLNGEMKVTTKALVKSNSSKNGPSLLFLVVPSVCLVAFAVIIVAFESWNLNEVAFERIPLEPIVNDELLTNNRRRLWKYHM